MTHVAVGSPWDQVHQGGHSHTEIPLSSIQNYFAEAGDLTPVRKQFEEHTFVGYRDESGILVLPKEWDDGEDMTKASTTSNTGKNQD